MESIRNKSKLEQFVNNKFTSAAKFYRLPPLNLLFPGKNKTAIFSFLSIAIEKTEILSSRQ